MGYRLDISEIDKLIELYETGKKQLNNEDLIDLADELLQFDPSKDWLGTLHHIREPGCGFVKFYKDRGAKCDECSIKYLGNCQYIISIDLSVYIYENLVENLPEDRKTLCAFLRGY